VIGGIGQRIGVVIDRDIGVCGMVQGRSEETNISEINSDHIGTVSTRADLETCCDRLERPQ